MNYPSNCVILILFAFSLQNCNTARQTVVTSTETIHKIHIETLVADIKKYHGLTIQTKGLYDFSFEFSAIFPARPEYVDGKFLFRYASPSGLWVEFNPKYISFDSIPKYSYRKTNLLLTIQGKVDTTQTEHMGMYIATITDARIVEDN